MGTYKSAFLQVLEERGFIYQGTDLEALDEKACTDTITGYIGYDLTAESLHVGNLVGIMMLHWLQQTGHRPLVLMGGATTKIGDPSGKDNVRKLVDTSQIDKNEAGIKKVFDRLLTFGNGEKDAVMVNNDDWLAEKNYIDFLRDVGAHFTINRMLTMESVKLRLDREQPLTFLEFNYMIFQAYDFMELNKRMNCTLQMGGSEQWGNIVSGVDLTRRLNSTQVFGLTSPLITTSSGKKMGKSENGAIWLNQEMMPVYDYWQFWRNCDDADVSRLLKIFTTLPMDEVTKLEALQGQEVNEAKKVLATEATALIHGREAAEKAAKTAEETFVKGASSEGLPTVQVSQIDVADGIAVVDLFIKTTFVNSKGEARRLIKGGGARVNDEVITDENMMLQAQDFANDPVKLSAGKKRHALVSLG